MSFRSPRILLVLVAVLALASSAPATGAGASTSDAVSTALAQLEANPSSVGATSADVRDVVVTSAYTSRHNGVTHVNVNQAYEGLEVFGGHATVNVAADGRVVFVGGGFERGLAVAASAVELGAADAVAAAADALGLDEPERLRVLSLSLGSGQESVVSDGGISNEPIPARLGWQPTKEGLRLAWQLVIDDASESHLWNATVDAGDGRLLGADDWTDHDSFEDLDSTIGATLARSTASAAAIEPPVSTNPVLDGSSYRVFELPFEGPNDGERTLVENPADGDASPYGWHDTDGADGPEFTTLRGNNLHAYLDQDANNQPDFGEPDGGAGLDFDFPVDFGEHSQAYREAVVTNLFFGCNVVHDLMWIYGFDEASGNFQANNYGRGGGEGDYVRCEAADGGGTNNANFSTPAADSGTPRMQMYLWPGNQLGSQNQVVVDGVGDFGAGWARFGPPAPSAGVSGAFFDAGNGCAAADYAGAPAGDWIAVVVGGNTGCQAIQKAHEADAAGANAIVMATGTSSTGIISAGSGNMAVASPAIPAVVVSTANGDAIRAALPASGTVRKHPSHPGIRDGDFDFAIIGHEYGHGVSNRLTGGPGVNCLSGDERMGEGWSDYIGLVIPLTPELDDPQEPRGLVPYVLFQPDRHGNGLRPRPYTRDMTIQPFTYDSIKTNAWLSGSLATPHGVGHGWNSVLWDMTWDLIDKHGFYANLYEGWDNGGNTRSMQYVMDGLKLQGCAPSFVVGRDAIIAAQEILTDGEDRCTLWASFSRRGLGFSASDGGSTGRNDGTEAFDTDPGCRRGFQVPVHQPYGVLNVADAGSAVPLRFRDAGLSGLDILMPTNSPFSRRVDCETLTVPSIGERITPREYPIDTAMPGGSALTRSATGVYTYPWKTQEDWAGTCRELVLTRLDGVQHRAFFQFVASES
jgi:hypothetical protein